MAEENNKLDKIVLTEERFFFLVSLLTGTHTESYQGV